VNGDAGLSLKGGVSPMKNCSMVDVLPRITITETFQGYTETLARSGVGDVTVFYHTNNGCDEVIRKPVIVVDGFDPNSERVAFNKDPDKSIYAQLRYNGTANNMGDDLRAQGYDVIILDFPKYSVYTIQPPGYSRPRPYYEYIDGGTDYIERNALVLKQLIRNINLHLQQISSTEQIVVVGPSMGGLIARYALAKMEQTNEIHNTSLFVSFDTPHMGANIP
jgi:pimeloyl-ACP methyl ester carboxylesterase